MINRRYTQMRQSRRIAPVDIQVYLCVARKTVFMMRNIPIILVLAFVASCVAKDLVVGSSVSARLAWRTKVNAMSFPFKKRVKEIFYSNPEQMPIRAIIVRDLHRTEGSVESIRAGGLGFAYANIRLKSRRGYGLNYQIEIYV